MRRRTVVAYAAAVLAVATVAGCANEAPDHSGAADRPSSEFAPESEAAPDEQNDAADDGQAGSGGGVIARVQDETFDRDIIYTIDLEIATEDIDEASAQAGAVARRAGGFVADEQTTTSRSMLTLRIPTEEHTGVVSQLEELGEVTSRNRSTEDVTQQVVDTESRITSQRQSIARIQALLDEAGDLSDVISIEAELASREADLDALLSRQERLSDLTALATVSVTFRVADAPDEDDDEPAVGFLPGLQNGWNAFTDVIAVALAVLGAVLPFLIIAVPVAVALWIWAGRRRRQAPSQPVAPEAVPPAP